MDFKVILVNSEESLNIGSVARVMKNLGYSDLRLVSPSDFRVERASITACHALDLVQSARHFVSLEDAISDLNNVVGFSARDGDNRPPPLPLADWVTGHVVRSPKKEKSEGSFLSPPVQQQDFNPEVHLIIDSSQERGSFGLVFGPESTGLQLKDALLCQRMVFIPASQAYSSFNLSHAVAITLYELNRSGVGTLTQSHSAPARVSRLAEQGEVAQLVKLVNEVAEVSEFYRSGTPPVMKDLVPHLINRMEPSSRDVAILLGLFSRIKKKLQKGDSR